MIHNCVLQEALIEVDELEEDLKDIEDLRAELSTFFGEEEATFKLEECFKTLQTFCDRFKKAIEVREPMHSLLPQ